MRIYQPQNEFGQALLHEGMVQYISKAITATLDKGCIVLTDDNLYIHVDDWEVRSIGATINGQDVAFTPDIIREEGKIKIVFCGEEETIEGIGVINITLGLKDAHGFILKVEIPIEQKIAEAIASGDKSLIKGVAIEAVATGREEYKFAASENINDLNAAAGGTFNKNVAPTNLMCLVDGTQVFKESTFDTFEAEMPCLEIGKEMFYNNTKLIGYSGDLPSLTDGSNMFRKCNSMKSFEGELPELVNGQLMFGDNSSPYNVFSQFKVPSLPKLTIGTSMFHLRHRLTEWNIALPELVNGSQMFRGTSITTFNSPMPKLVNGYYMFGTDTGSTPSTFGGLLKDFNTPLPKLVSGKFMFQGCTVLSQSSVLFIAEHIRDLKNDPATAEEKTLVASETYVGMIGFSKSITIPDDIKLKFTNKGWTVEQK